VSALVPLVGWALASLLAVAIVLVAALRDGVRHVTFAEPMWALAAVVPLAAVVVRVWLRPRPATMRFSRTTTLRRAGRGWAVHFVELPDGLRLGRLRF